MIEDTMLQIKVEADGDLIESVNNFMIASGWDSAIILGGIGSIKNAVYTAPTRDTLPLVIDKVSINKPMELVSVVGEVMKIELMDPELASVYDTTKPFFIHIHATSAVSGGQVYGGGFHGGKALRGATLFICKGPKSW